GDLKGRFNNSPTHQLVNARIRRLALFDAEGLAATAGRGRVRVLDREAAAGDGVDEVDFRARQIANADRIDEQLDAVRFENLIHLAFAVFFDHQPVLESRATAALDEHAQPASRLVFFGQQLADLRGR